MRLRELLSEAWKSQASNRFNLGGLLGALAAIPLGLCDGPAPDVRHLLRLLSRDAVHHLWRIAIARSTPCGCCSPWALASSGVFSPFVFYLPELFPARLRAMGSGLCYNIGRVVAALGPSIVGMISAAAGGSSDIIVRTMFWLGVIPLVMALAARFVIVETRGQRLPRLSSSILLRSARGGLIPVEATREHHRCGKQREHGKRAHEQRVILGRDQQIEKRVDAREDGTRPASRQPALECTGEVDPQ